MVKNIVFVICVMFAQHANAQDYQRNVARPVERVMFGSITSVRNITEKELIVDQQNGWKVFRGALIGGIIGHQFGSGSGNDIATILGAFIGATSADKPSTKRHEKIIRLVELMIELENGEQYMVVQARDNKMLFNALDPIRMIYFTDGTVRIDKQL